MSWEMVRLRSERVSYLSSLVFGRNLMRRANVYRRNDEMGVEERHSASQKSNRVSHVTASRNWRASIGAWLELDCIGKAKTSVLNVPLRQQGESDMRSRMECPLVHVLQSERGLRTIL